jgi:UDP-GlcNAc:undecaprenyl-phosphate/decaprenyl-phosphate GlcNAc-1-phosphate transferase
MNIFSSIFFPFALAFIATVICTPLSLVFIKKWKLFDDPKTHKHPAILHKKPIPRGGGIPLFFGIGIAALLILPQSIILSSLLLSAGIALFIGVLDDKLDISPYLRFAVNILCALIVVASGISVPFITAPQGGILHFDSLFFVIGPFIIHFSDIVAMLWIVWVMNMLNWSKGVDGQMPGIVAISAITIGILSLRFSQIDQVSLFSAQLSFIIAGACVGFLLFNFYPAMIFPGYGATCVYLLLAVVSILSGAKLATAILVMGVPMVDALFTLFRRIASGRSPFFGDKLHLHHLLLGLGWTQRKIALFYWSVSAILGVISLALSSKAKVFAIIMIGIIVGGAILFLHLALALKNDPIRQTQDHTE